MRPVKPPRSVVPLFRIVFHYGKDSYSVVLLAPDSPLVLKAYGLRKQTGVQPTYEIRLTYEGLRCNCKGYQYRHCCKHVSMLVEAGMLEEPRRPDR